MRTGGERFRTLLTAMIAWASVVQGCSDAEGERPDGPDTGATPDVTTAETSTPDGAPDQAHPDVGDPSVDAGPDTDATTNVPTADGRAADVDATKIDGPFADQDGADGDGATTDGDARAMDGDGSTCVEAPVWTSDSDGFTLSGSVFALEEAGCVGGLLFEFSRQNGTLSERGCRYYSPPYEYRHINRLVRLDSAQLDRIVAELTAMMTTCRAEQLCDVHFGGLWVRDAAGCVKNKFEANGDGCGLPPRQQPWVSYEVLSNFESTLMSITGVCDPPEGGGVPASCQLFPDAGSTTGCVVDPASPDAGD